jgi:hypothetical protein
MGGRHPICGGDKSKQGEEPMTVAQQAFLMTGELLALAFAAIFAIWFADRLRRNITGKP